MRRQNQFKGRKIAASKPGTGYLKPVQRHEMQQDKKLAQIDKKIRKLNNEAEVKYHDINCSVAPVQTTGDLVLLNGMGQGASQASVRIGARVKATSLQMRLWLQGPQSTVVDNEIIRIIVFWDNDAKGVAPDIVNDPLTGPALLNSANGLGVEFLNPTQLEQRERFKILYDKTHVLTPQMPLEVTPATGITNEIIPAFKSINKYIKLNRTVQYGDTTNGIASINNNSLWILYISSTGTATVQGVTRFSYKDF